MTSRIATLILVLLTAACSTAEECEVDPDCGTGVCARDGRCSPAADVRAVKTTWTINGVPATKAACAGWPLYIEFADDNTDERLEFDPVPCDIGQYSIDKLPLRFDSVEVGVDVDGGAWDATTIGAGGTARLDLPLGPAVAVGDPTHTHRRRRQEANSPVPGAEAR